MSLAVVIPFARFPLGRLYLTPGAEEALRQNGVCLTDLLTRHATGDWGEIGATDRHANEAALRNGLRLLSSYRLPSGESLWLLTEADRSATTALLPAEY
jgi:hypothetical protein